MLPHGFVTRLQRLDQLLLQHAFGSQRPDIPWLRRILIRRAALPFKTGRNLHPHVSIRKLDRPHHDGRFAVGKIHGLNQNLCIGESAQLLRIKVTHVRPGILGGAVFSNPPACFPRSVLQEFLNFNRLPLNLQACGRRLRRRRVSYFSSVLFLCSACQDGVCGTGARRCFRSRVSLVGILSYTDRRRRKQQRRNKSYPASSQNQRCPLGHRLRLPDSEAVPRLRVASVLKRATIRGDLSGIARHSRC